MSEHSHSAKKYFLVFAALIILSALTVGASYINFGLALGIAVALIIATVKGSLVASFFMHLISEKKLIYYTLIMTGVFFACMMFLFIFSHHSVPEGTKYLNTPAPAVQQPHDDHGDHHVS